MSKRVHPVVPENVPAENFAVECQRLSQEMTDYAITFARKAAEYGANKISQKVYIIHRNAYNTLRVSYYEAMQRLFKMDKTYKHSLYSKVDNDHAARVAEKEKRDAELAQQRQHQRENGGGLPLGTFTDETFTDIVHLLSARLSELEDHVCIKVNGV